MKNSHYFINKDGYFHIMFFISIKNIHHLNDIEIFKLLGFKNVHEVNFKIKLLEGDTRKIKYDDHIDCYVINDKEWTTIICSGYHLYHDSEIRNKLESISLNHDVFYATEGDIDDSFDYTYYKNSVLRRKYIVSQANFVDLIIDKDIGVFLEGEKEILKEEKPKDKIIGIAKIIGINLQYNDSMRVYNLNIIS